MLTYTSASITFRLSEKRTRNALNLLLPIHNRRNPERDKRTDTSLTRWIIPIRPNAFADRNGFIPEFSVIDAKLAEAKVHRPAGGFGCRSQRVVDTLEAQVYRISVNQQT